MLQEFLCKVAKMDKTYVGCSTLQEFLLKVAKMDKTYGREVCCKSFYARWQKWGCSMLRMMAKNDKIIGWIRQHKI